MIGTDVQNTTRPDLKGGAQKGAKGNPLESDFRRQMIKQVIIDRMRKGA